MKSREERRQKARRVMGWEVVAIVVLLMLWAVVDDQKGYGMLSDGFCLLLIEIVLVALVIMSIGQAVAVSQRPKRERTNDAYDATVGRGDRSMNALYVMYGVATISCGLAVDVSQAFIGYKVLLIIFNYGSLTYLFFFNSWFRNTLVFPLFIRVQQD
jgi:hypothetical protein